jgi:hypothetical protein
MLSKIIRFQGEKVTKGWRKLNSEEFYDLHSSPYVISDKMKGTYGTYGGD